MCALSLRDVKWLRCIFIIVKDHGIINSITKILYPYVAKLHDTTSAKVERGICNAIDVIFKKGNIVMLNEFFGHTTYRNARGAPTNSEFIAVIADFVRLRNGHRRLAP